MARRAPRKTRAAISASYRRTSFPRRTRSQPAKARKAERQNEGEEGRFRRFTREEIAARGDSLDICWLRDGEEEAEDDLTDLDDITAAILGHLRQAMREIEALVLEREGEEEGATPAAVAAE